MSARNLNDILRVEALKGYKILDTNPEQEFDDFTELAATICGARISLISFVDEHRQWFKSKVGLEVTETSREVAFCSHAIENPSEPFIIRDASIDDRFSKNPLVLGDPNIRFYAGIPLVDLQNNALGTLCVIDDYPRDLSEHQIEALKILARNIIRLLVLRREKKQAESQVEFLSEVLNLQGGFYLIVDKDEDIIGFGSKLLKPIPELRIESNLSNYFSFNAPFNFSKWLKSDESKSKRLYFINSIDGIMKFKFSAAKIYGLTVIMMSPVINTNYPIKNYNLNFSDFEHHDYISEYLFLQQTTARSLADTDQVLQSIRENRMEILSAKVKKQFLANMTHEIRNPVNVIHGMVEQLSETKIDRSQKKYIEALMKTSGHLNRLVNDILSVSKLDSFSVKIEKKTFNLYDLVQNIYFSQRTLLKKDIHFSSVFEEPRDLWVEGDPSRIDQILSNLLNNAFKFTNEGGEVSIRTESILIDEKRFTKFTIRDTGIGIPDHMVDSIFNIFEQIDNNHKIDYENGVGLGLAIIKKLVDLLNGTIEVESEVGVGTAFYICIPFENYEIKELDNIKKEADLTQKHSSIINFSKPPSIIIADDEDFNLDILQDRLKNIQTKEIIRANDGNEVLNLISPEIDLIILDYRMPLMDGVKTTEHIRNNAIYPINSIPIIMITANVDEAGFKDMYEKGVDQLIMKPYTREILESNIKEYIGLYDSDLFRHSKREDVDSVLINYRELGSFCSWERGKMIKYIIRFREEVQKHADILDNHILQKDYVEIADYVHRLNTKLVFMNLNVAREISFRIEDACRKESGHNFEEIKNDLFLLKEHMESFEKSVADI